MSIEIQKHAAPSGAPQDDSNRMRLPYQLGVFLAVNAVPDAYAVVDGPDCVLRKAEWVYGRHDLNSTLMDVLGGHRVVNTLLNAERVIHDRGDDLGTRLRQVGAQPGAAVALVCAMPHVTIIGTQYDKVIRGVQRDVAMPIALLPSRSLDGDWLDGYADALAALAECVDLSGAVPDPNRVAVVGYLMDRTEEDHAANVRELGRMFAAAGLELCSVWLGNDPYAELSRVAGAGTIVSLPSGRKAARTLARRTGAKLIEARTPFGPGRTRAMLRAVGAATGRGERVEEFIERETMLAVRRLEWVVPHVLLGRRVVFSGAPELFGGFLQMAEEVGLEVALLHAWCSREHLDEDLAAEFAPLPPVLCAPRESALLSTLRACGDVDLIVSNSLFSGARDPSYAGAKLEFGFPSHFNHALFERPFLGFRGWMCFLDQAVRAMSKRNG